jgi:DNA-binding MarR family transcriptional regulator
MHIMGENVSEVAKAVLDRCLWQRTRAAARIITRFYDEEIRSMGLRATQVSVLVTVAANSELSISALSDELGMDRTTLTRNLRPLEQRGLLVISPEGRHRIRQVRLTPAGEAALAKAVEHWERAQAAMERRLGKAGVATVRQSAAAVTAAASRPIG